jgi:hypothetical protein
LMRLVQLPRFELLRLAGARDVDLLAGREAR